MLSNGVLYKVFLFNKFFSFWVFFNVLLISMVELISNKVKIDISFLLVKNVCVVNCNLVKLDCLIFCDWLIVCKIYVFLLFLLYFR